MFCIVGLAFIVSSVAFILLIQEVIAVCKERNYELRKNVNKESIMALLLLFWISMLLFPFIAYILLTPSVLSDTRASLIVKVEEHIQDNQ